MSSRPLHRRALVLLEAAIGAVLFLMMVLTCVDVVGRYLLARPVVGADELIAVGMAIVIFGGLPLVSARGEQITVDLLVSRFRGAVRRIQALAVAAVSAGALAYLAYRLVHIALRLERAGDHSTLLQIPYAPVAYFMGAMAAIACLLVVVGTFARRMPTASGQAAT
jgi:TRAP-type C4-dicarboxylate transport system permease small subunit